MNFLALLTLLLVSANLFSCYRLQQTDLDYNDQRHTAPSKSESYADQVVFFESYVPKTGSSRKHEAKSNQPNQLDELMSEQFQVHKTKKQHAMIKTNPLGNNTTVTKAPSLTSKHQLNSTVSATISTNVSQTVSSRSTTKQQMYDDVNDIENLPRLHKDVSF